MKQDINVTKSSGNIFADLELSEHKELTIKSDLVIRLKDLMKLHKLTQKEVAKRCRTDQPTLSKVLNGRLDLVTSDRIISWLVCLNQDIAITIRDNFTSDEIGSGNICVYAG